MHLTWFQHLSIHPLDGSSIDGVFDCWSIPNHDDSIVFMFTIAPWKLIRAHTKRPQHLL